MKLIEDQIYYDKQSGLPTPKVFSNDTLNLIVIITNWGPTDLCSEVFNIIETHLETELADMDATRPYPYLPNLSSEENKLRNACLVANQKIFESYNSNELKEGVEVVALKRRKNSLIFAQYGSPHIFISRKNQTLIPAAFNLNFFTTSNKDCQYLPSKLLGTNKTCDFEIQSIKTEDTDHVLCVSQESIPSTLYTLKNNSIDIEKIMKKLSKNSKESIWASVIKLSA